MHKLAEAERVERSHPEGWARFERGGLATCPALPCKLAVMRGFEPLDPCFKRASDFPGQLFKPLTHITAFKLAESIRFERMTPIRCSALAVRRLRPLGQLSIFRILVPAGGIEPPRRETLRFECSASSIPPGRHMVGRSGGSRTPKPEGA